MIWEKTEWRNGNGYRYPPHLHLLFNTREHGLKALVIKHLVRTKFLRRNSPERVILASRLAECFNFRTNALHCAAAGMGWEALPPNEVGFGLARWGKSNIKRKTECWKGGRHMEPSLGERHIRGWTTNTTPLDMRS
jgi:hypothetical protein